MNSNNRDLCKYMVIYYKWKWWICMIIIDLNNSWLYIRNRDRIIE